MKLRMMTVSMMTVFALGCGTDEPAPGDDEISFSALRVEQIGATRAVVTFETSVPTSCELEFGSSQMQMDQTATDPDMAPGQLEIDHSVPMEDLIADTVYFVRARATNADGVSVRSPTIRFSTVLLDDPTAGMTNIAGLAHGTIVSSVSSNWAGGDNDSSFGIHNAIDGNMASEWSSASDGDNAFVELDLGQTRTITHFAYRSRKMTDGTSIVKSVQLRGDDNMMLGPFLTPNPDVRYVFKLDTPLLTRMIRLDAVETTGGNTGAKEIQFFIVP